MSRNDQAFHVTMFRRRAFGEASGLIYDETVVAARPHSETWSHMTRGKVRKIRLLNRRGPGASTLTDMVKRKLALHTPDLEAELFEGINWYIMKPLWEYLQAKDLVSLHTWKVFSQAYPDEDCLKHHIIHASRFVTSNNWRSSLNPIVSPDFRFITVLTIYATGMTRSDLLSLPEITNLGTLTIREDVSVLGLNGRQSDLDDFVLRSWSRRANEEGYLSHLRALHFQGHKKLTADCLQWVSLLPSLAIFSCDESLYTSIDPEKIRSLAWEFDRPLPYDRRSAGQLADGAWQSEDREGYIAGAALHKRSLGSKETARINSLPMLHVTVVSSHPSAPAPGCERVCLKREAHAMNTWTRPAGSKRKLSKSGSIAARPVKARNMQESSTTLAEFGL